MIDYSSYIPPVLSILIIFLLISNCHSFHHNPSSSVFLSINFCSFFLFLSSLFFHIFVFMVLIKICLWKKSLAWLSLDLAISLGHYTGAFWSFALELIKLPFILSRFCWWGEIFGMILLFSNFCQVPNLWIRIGFGEIFFSIAEFR